MAVFFDLNHGNFMPPPAAIAGEQCNELAPSP
jgi:hypothetical protein